VPIDDRVRINYYHIGLYGKHFEEEDGKEYIMRVYNFTSIGNVKFFLQEKYRKRFNLQKNPDKIRSNEIGNIK
jgi:ribosomal protein L24E